MCHARPLSQEITPQNSSFVNHRRKKKSDHCASEKPQVFHSSTTKKHIASGCEGTKNCSERKDGKIFPYLAGDGQQEFYLAFLAQLVFQFPPEDDVNGYRNRQLSASLN
jgi:hypothetical protein